MSPARGGDDVRAARRWLPATLVSPESAMAMISVADLLPSPAGVLIECPLSGATAAADLSLAFGRTGLAGEPSLTPASLPVNGEWDRLRPFLAAWADPTGPLRAEVQSVWLEFDLRTWSRSQLPVPNLFFGTSRETMSHDAIVAGLRLLTAQQSADSAVAALAPGVPVVFAGVMIARQPAAVRFCHDAAPGPTLSLLGDLRDAAPRVVIQTEAGTAADGRIGFELYQPRAQRGRSGVWQPLMQRLIEAGMATHDRCEAALQWPGYGYDEAVSPRVVRRWINHLKLIYDAGVLTEAKVYLQCGTAWTPSADSERV